MNITNVLCPQVIICFVLRTKYVSSSLQAIWCINLHKLRWLIFSIIFWKNGEIENEPGFLIIIVVSPQPTYTFSFYGSIPKVQNALAFQSEKLTILNNKRCNLLLVTMKYECPVFWQWTRLHYIWIYFQLKI